MLKKVLVRGANFTTIGRQKGLRSQG